mmetsp:Transcript_11981/g.25918  ORF Transcript_11981/g.25918 Transcript_11981/m.25918 type:complete len:146 (+) Transcript_11981:1-438(+)
MASERNSNISAQPQAWSTRPTDPTDAFSKYSDDATRLRALLLVDDEEEFDLRDFAARHYGTGRAANIDIKDDINSSRECNPQDDGCRRKTRISFEVHPSLILDDIFLELEQEQEQASNDGEGAERSGSDMASGIEELMSILHALG